MERTEMITTLNSIKETSGQIADERETQAYSVGGFVLDAITTIAFLRMRRPMGYLAAAAFAINCYCNIDRFFKSFEKEQNLKQEFDADCLLLDTCLTFNDIQDSKKS